MLWLVLIFVLFRPFDKLESKYNIGRDAISSVTQKLIPRKDPINTFDVDWMSFINASNCQQFYIFLWSKPQNISRNQTNDLLNLKTVQFYQLIQLSMICFYDQIEQALAAVQCM